MFSPAARICTCTKLGVVPFSSFLFHWIEGLFPGNIPDADIQKQTLRSFAFIGLFPLLVCVFLPQRIFVFASSFFQGAKAEGRIEGHKKEDRKNRAECVTGSVRYFSNRTKSLSLTALLCANSSPGIPSRFPHPEAVVCLVLSPLRALFLPVSPLPPPPPKNEIQYPRLILLLPTKPKIEKPGNRHTQKNVRNRGEGR